MKILRIGTDDQTNFPSDVRETFSCLLLHACSQKMRIYGPWVGPWDSWGGAVGLQLVELGGALGGVVVKGFGLGKIKG